MVMTVGLSHGDSSWLWKLRARSAPLARSTHRHRGRPGAPATAPILRLCSPRQADRRFPERISHRCSATPERFRICQGDGQGWRAQTPTARGAAVQPPGRSPDQTPQRLRRRPESLGGRPRAGKPVQTRKIAGEELIESRFVPGQHSANLLQITHWTSYLSRQYGMTGSRSYSRSARTVDKVVDATVVAG